jgi:hypothetical protein
MLPANLHNIGFPYQYCSGEIDSHLFDFFSKWLHKRNRTHERVIFLNEPFTDYTIVAMRSLGGAILSQNLSGRYITDAPFEVKENYIYIIPYADSTFTKLFPVIVAKGAFAWVFSHRDIDIDELHSKNSFCVNGSLPERSVSQFAEV